MSASDGVSPQMVADLSSPVVRAQLQAHIDSAGSLPPTGSPDEYAALFETVRSFSLKDVQPALVPEMGDYEALVVQDGTMAGVAYLKMIDPHTPASVAKQIRKDLLAYCGHDTLGTVRLYQKLLDIAP